MIIIIMCVQATLYSNTVGTHRPVLVVDVDGVREEMLSLPMKARLDTFTCEHTQSVECENLLKRSVAEVSFVIPQVVVK